ncbi:hypothetical protein ABPG75_011814 [Micractinium tetrahymenae]
MGDRATRVLLYQFRFALVLALAILIWETAVKFTEPNSELIQFDSLVTVNTIIASICLAVGLAVASLLLYRIWAVRRAGRVWAQLRTRTVLLFGAELAVQLVNLVFFLAPNALVLAQPCSWFLSPIHAFGIVRWTCWNTLFCLFVVQAHSPLPARFTGKAILRSALSGAKRPVQAAQQLLARTGSAALRGMDAGWAAAQSLMRLSPLSAAPWQQQQRGAGQAKNGFGRQASAPPAPLAAGSTRGRLGVAPAPPHGRAAAAAGGAAGVGPRAAGQQSSAAEQDVEAIIAASPFVLAAKPEPAGPGTPAAAAVVAAAGATAAAPSAAAPSSTGAGAGGGSREGLDIPIAAEEERLVMELPFQAHYGKALLLWLPCQVVLVCFSLYIWGVIGSHAPPCTSISDVRCFPQAANGTEDCRRWRYNCAWYTNDTALMFSCLVSALCMLTLVVYFGLILYAQRQLARRPYVLFRNNNVLLRTQFQTRLLAASFFLLSNTLFWYISGARAHNCTSYMETWLGLTPMQIVMTSLVVLNTICVLPADPGLAHHDLHAWLQDFAWLEKDLPHKLKRRPVPAEEPMFCVETALKLLCWSWVVYYDHQREDDAAEKGGAKASSTTSEGEAGQGAGGEAERRANGSGAAADQAHPAVEEAATQQEQQQRQQPDAVARQQQQQQQQELHPPGAQQQHQQAEAQQQQQQEQQPPGAQQQRHKHDPCMDPPEDVTLATALGLYSLTHHTVLFGPQHDAKCLIGWSPAEGVVVVCFRGTCSLTNVLNNMKVWRTPHPPLRGSYWTCSRPMVHRGFLASYEASGLNVQVMETLSAILAARPQPWRLLFTGHSLGGALASLAAYDTARLLQSRQLPQGCRSSQVVVYTFGCPREGNYAFARDYGRVVPCSFDVIHADDTVTRNGKFLVLYKRSAHRVVLSPTGDLIIRPSLLERTARESFATSFQQHLLSAYARSFAALIRGQFDRDKEHNGGRRGCQALLQCEYVQQVLRITANMRSESMAGMAGARRRLLHAPSMPPGPDRHPASGEPLTQSQQRRAAAAAAAATPWAPCRLSGLASWQVQRSAGSLSWPPLGSRGASSLDMDRLASV